MYTVLIFDNRTAESFGTFRPLFVEMLRKEEIDICVWTKDLTGDRIEAALPKIYDMVGDKKEWRAIVVQSYLGDFEGEFEVDRRNPFDYKCNREAYLNELRTARAEKRDPNFNMKEPSKIPMVVLSQMLGGVPEQSPIFDEGDEVFDTKTQKYRKSVHSRVDVEAEVLHKKLERQYRFQANRPQELLLVAVRPQSDVDYEQVRQSWTDYDILESSQFWSYNHYASNCRFITYDIEQKGSVQAQGDLLKLWLAIGILATNPLDPSSFQAYHLYNIALKMDREKLANAFHNTAVRLESASRYLQRSIDQDHKRYLNERIDPPEYDVFVDVTVEDKRLGEFLVSEERYALAAQDFEADAKDWERDCNSTDESIQKLRRMTGRAVEGAAERMRGNCLYDEELVTPLSNFQSKEFSEQLKDTYQEMLDNQVMLQFDELYSLQKAKKDQRKKVLTMLRSRMDSGKLIKGYLVVVLASIAAVLPSLYHAYKTETSVLKPILGTLAVSSLVYFIALIIVAVVHYNEVTAEIGTYNKILALMKEKINKNASAYAKFLSSVGSHMKGSSYINILQKKIFRREDITQQKRHHLDEINKFKMILSEWAKSVYIECDFDLVDQDESVEFDEMDIPEFESLYTLETGKSYKIPINKSGMLTSSYSFITGLEVVREELYDDAIFARDIADRDSE